MAVLLLLWTLAPLFTLLGGHGVFDGVYGIDAPDLMQYMGFIRDSAEHVLISNVFDTASSPHLLLDPGFALSGLAWRLGASIQFAMLMWVPISVVALFFSFRAYARRMLGPEAGLVALALMLAFFFFTPAQPLAQWLSHSAHLQFGTTVVALELFAGAYGWGGAPAIAIAAVPAFMLAIERVLDPSRRASGQSRRWYGTWAALAGALASWLHPWQGMAVLATVAVLVAWGGFRRRYLALALPVLATAAPLAYYVALSRTHTAFGTAARGASGYEHFGWWFWLGMAPLLLALPGFPGRHLDVQERIVRIWPIAAVAVYVALDRTWFYHLFDGLTLPLAILAIRGWRRLRWPRLLGAAAVVAVTVPGLVWVVQDLVKTRPQDFFRPGEARALAFLSASPQAGAVLSPIALGQAVPGFTGRHTYVGHYEWTPDLAARTAYTEALFEGRLTRVQTQDLLRVSRAGFLLADCARDRPDLTPLLGKSLVWARSFGCATVYRVRTL